MERDDDANEYGADVVVEFGIDERASRTVPIPLGHGPTSPLLGATLRAKFVDCAARVLRVGVRTAPGSGNPGPAQA